MEYLEIILLILSGISWGPSICLIRRKNRIKSKASYTPDILISVILVYVIYGYSQYALQNSHIWQSFLFRFSARKSLLFFSLWHHRGKLCAINNYGKCANWLASSIDRFGFQFNSSGSRSRSPISLHWLSPIDYRLSTIDYHCRHCQWQQARFTAGTDNVPRC